RIDARRRQQSCPDTRAARLASQHLVQSPRAEFAGCVSSVAGECGAVRARSDSHYVSTSTLVHGREELPDQKESGNDTGLEGRQKFVRFQLGNRFYLKHARVVDDDIRHSAELLTNEGCC